MSRLRRRRPFPPPAPALLALLLLAAGVGCRGEPAPGGPASSARAPAPGPAGEPESLGEGFVVWESNRDGAWRIWRRDLDGTAPRRLTADEPGRSHCCAHVSPDGARIAYLSLEPGQTGYEREGGLGELRVIESDGSGERTVAAAARTYYENRGAVWRGAEELIYVDGDRQTRALELATGRDRPLTEGPPPTRGRLVDPELARAASGLEGFFAYDRERRRVVERTPLGGCQFYFSQDGRWGYWMAGAGGPIRALPLAGGEASTVLSKNDPRLPDGLGYLYFPMLSADATLLAFAASAGEHDHFDADYEILVAEVEPESLELAGPPLRWTRDPATDRFPDVYRRPLALGRHAGEAPFRLALEPAASEGGPWEWSWGDGASSRGGRGERVYERPGRYAIEARSGEALLRGQVVVAAARPPRALAVSLAAGGERLTIRFDEPVRVEGATLTLASGGEARVRGTEAGGRVLVADLDPPLDRTDRVRVAGVVDRAQRPNELAPVELEIPPPSWPSEARHAELVWEHGAAPNLVAAIDGPGEQSVVLSAHGPARLDHDFALRPSGGWFEAPPELANRLRFGARGRNAISLEAVIEPDPAPGSGRAVIVSQEASMPNFRLVQRGDRVAFEVRVGLRGPESVEQVDLFPLPPGRKSHVAVSYTPGRLSAWLDGELRVDTDRVQGDLFHWRSDPLRFGAGPGGRAAWRGGLEGVAIYSRPFAPGEPAENHLRYRRLLEERPAAPEWRLAATREGCTPTPDPAEIAPYREALVVCRFGVERTLEGEPRGERIAAAVWALLDGERQPLPGAAGAPVTLTVERFADNPQLESVYLADDRPTAEAETLYFVTAAGPR